ncbi:hypothetical protein [Candidatus Roseilinea sp. NK_OTU-006]|jgi:hypothetical protein|uniref:hypothetical protein n=1 Tax=Candidatus Roseilinea sp. NK_OTU-006 TaxID=2704250 RepID=UPI00145D5232|nr:hypothetical protein [Candidatus Roseilinea sp. NK_OTU-006]
MASITGDDFFAVLSPGLSIKDQTSIHACQGGILVKKSLAQNACTMPIFPVHSVIISIITSNSSGMIYYLVMDDIFGTLEASNGALKGVHP